MYTYICLPSGVVGYLMITSLKIFHGVCRWKFFFENRSILRQRYGQKFAAYFFDPPCAENKRLSWYTFTYEPDISISSPDHIIQFSTQDYFINFSERILRILRFSRPYSIINGHATRHLEIFSVKMINYTKVQNNNYTFVVVNLAGHLLIIARHTHSNYRRP